MLNNFKLLKPLGIHVNELKAKQYDLEFYLDPISEKADAFLKELKYPYIFLHNGSSTFKKGSEKRRLHAFQIEKLISAMIDKGYQVVFNVGPEEKEQGDYLQEKMKKQVLQNRLVLTSGFSISDVSYILKGSYKVISTDSGIHHLASALKKEVILISGPTDERKIYPWNAKYHLISAPVKCRPCYVSYTQKSFECKNNWECIQYIDIKHIVDMI